MAGTDVVVTGSSRQPVSAHRHRARQTITPAFPLQITRIPPPSSKQTVKKSIILHAAPLQTVTLSLLAPRPELFLTNTVKLGQWSRANTQRDVLSPCLSARRAIRQSVCIDSASRILGDYRLSKHHPTNMLRNSSKAHQPHNLSPLNPLLLSPPCIPLIHTGLHGPVLIHAPKGGAHTRLRFQLCKNG